MLWASVLGCWGCGLAGATSGAVPELKSQTVRVEQARLYSVRDGLSVGELRTVAPGADGGIWVGGQNGLQSFDGARFGAIKHPERLPQLRSYANVNWVSATTDHVYFAWADEALRSDLRTGELMQASATGWRAPQTELRPTSDNIRWCDAGVWVWTLVPSLGGPSRVTLRRLDRATGRTQQLSVDAPANIGNFGGLTCTAERALWVEAGANTVAPAMQVVAVQEDASGQIGGVQPTRIPLPPSVQGASGVQVRPAMLDADHVLLFGEKGLTRLRLSDLSFTRPDWSLPPGGRFDWIYFDTEEAASLGKSVWLSGGDGVLREIKGDSLEVVREVDTARLPRMRQIDAPVPSAARVVRIGDTDTLWVGRSDTLTRIAMPSATAQSETVPPESREQANPNTRFVCLSPDGRRWVRTLREDVFTVPLLDSRGQPQATQGTATRVVPRIACDVDGSAWALTPASELVHLWVDADGVLRQQLTPLTRKIEGSGGVVAATPDALWLMGNADVHRVDRRSLGKVQSFSVPGAKFVRTVALSGAAGQERLLVLSRESKMWSLEPATGVWRAMDGGSAIEAHLPLFDLRAAPDGAVWALARDGAVFQGTPIEVGADALTVRWRHLANPEPPKRRQYYCMVPGRDGSWWLSSTDGLVRVDGTTGHRQALTPESGVMWTDFNRNACSAAPDGRLSFGAMDGWTVVRPDAYRAPALTPPPRIVEYSAGQEAPVYPDAGRPTLSMDQLQHLLRVRLMVPYQMLAGRTDFSYRLDGYDADWRRLQQGADIEYTELPAGQHLLRVRASLDDGPWGPELQVPIRVHPPWYRHPLALLTYALMALGVLVIWAWRYRQRLRERADYVQRIENSEERLSRALRASGNAIWEYDLDSGHMFRTVWPWRSRDAAPMAATVQAFGADVHPDDADRVTEAFGLLQTGQVNEARCEYRLRGADGGWVWIADRGTRVDHQDGRQVRRLVVGTMTDITAIRAVQDELAHLAAHDPLTGLFNRRAYVQRLQQLTAADSGSELTLISLDLDRFKQVNDALGHIAGDQLLVALARKMERVVRDSGLNAALYRQGGDEFAVICPGSQFAAHMDLARALSSAVAEPVTRKGVELVVTASIGAAHFPTHARDPEGLQTAADATLHHAKRSGRNTVAVFDPADLRDAPERMHLETGLRMALPRGEFRLHYQPIQDLASGDCVCVEALLRWDHPVWGGYKVEYLVSILEESDLIHVVGQWALDAALAQFASWRAEGLRLPQIAVNISAMQLLKPQFPTLLERALRRHRVDPDCVILELTESVLLSEEPQVAIGLHQLKALGVLLAIDDFGKGYSSLERLRQQSVDETKIDRIFVAGIDTDPAQRAFCGSLIQMMKQLDMVVVAEGVETEAQRQVLQELGCDKIQGFLYARAMDAAQATPWLRAHQSALSDVRR